MQADVIVVGAGLAGMAAALAAEEAGGRVVLLDRGAIGGGSNSALSNGAFAAPDSAEAVEAFVALVRQVGRGLNRPAYVRQVAREAPAAMEFLGGLGLDIGHRPGQRFVRSPRPRVIPGTTLVRGVAERLRGRATIRLEAGVRATAILQDAGGAAGVRGRDLAGAEREYRASAVILACGGAGAIYARHDNQAAILGQGYHLAAQAGLALWDMEFVQFYPILLDEPGLPMAMIYPPYPPEARLLDAAGRDLLAAHDLGEINRAIVQQRDAFAALLAEESRRGAVRMDLTRVPEARWATHPLSLLRQDRFDFRGRPVRVGPGTHFCMGGVRTDEEGQTELPGLYACGEMVWGLHGANRMGGNALTECLVSGRLAGRGAARRRGGPRGEGLVAPPPPPEGTRTVGREELLALRRRIQETAWEFAGVSRSQMGMERGLYEAGELWGRLAESRADTVQARGLREDLLSATFVLRAILTAGLTRPESRGAFLRNDAPEEDEAGWRRNSRLTWDPAGDRFARAYPPAETE